MISIREETECDRDAIHQITVEAFSHSDFGHNGEAELIRELRNVCDDTLSLVACDGDSVVGHILFTPVILRDGSRELAGMGLAPMSVAVSCQRSGIGSRLVKAGLERLSKRDCPFVVVLGHADFYPRFGFSPAHNVQIQHGFEGIPQDVFFIAELKTEVLETMKGGFVYYDSAFGPQRAA